MISKALDVGEPAGHCSRCMFDRWSFRLLPLAGADCALSPAALPLSRVQGHLEGGDVQGVQLRGAGAAPRGRPPTPAAQGAWPAAAAAAAAWLAALISCPLCRALARRAPALFSHSRSSLACVAATTSLLLLLQVRTQFRKIFTQMGFEEMPTNNYVESRRARQLLPPSRNDLALLPVRRAPCWLTLLCAHQACRPCFLPLLPPLLSPQLLEL